MKSGLLSYNAEFTIKNAYSNSQNTNTKTIVFLFWVFYMCKFVYVCMYVYMCVYMYCICLYVRVGGCTCACMFVWFKNSEVTELPSDSKSCVPLVKSYQSQSHLETVLIHKLKGLWFFVCEQGPKNFHFQQAPKG